MLMRLISLILISIKTGLRKMQYLFEQIFMYINKLSVDNLKHDKLSMVVSISVHDKYRESSSLII